MATPQDFIDRYNGYWVDYDGVYGAQCVDGFKIFCSWAGIPVKACPDGWAQSYWTSRYALGYGNYFHFITDRSQVKEGDWCIWLKGSSNAYSHIAMYVRNAGGGRGYYFGENQGGANGSFNITTCYNDFAGALRWKNWSKDTQKHSEPDQILTVGSKVRFYEVTLDKVDPDFSKNLVYSSTVGGWFSGSIFTETTDADGALDQIVMRGSRGKIDGVFTVGDINIPAQTVYLNELGFWVRSEALEEIEEGN